MFKIIERCRICGNASLEPILHLGEQHLTGVFPRSPADPLTCGPLELVKCHGSDSCGLVQLHHSYESSEMYGANYGYRSSLNRSMVAHLQAKTKQLLELARPRAGDLVLDIGSNDGTLLGFYPSDLMRVGMDPTAAKFREYYQPGITVVPDFFSGDTFRKVIGDAKVKIVTSIAMFYDLQEPMRFMRDIAGILAEDGIWHFEQSYMPQMLEQNAYDTICHEHLEYYGLKQIVWMTNECGLRIVDVELNDVNGGSFAVTVCLKDAHYDSHSTAIDRILKSEQAMALNTLEPFRQFEKRVFTHRSALLDILENLLANGQSILGYGASTKGNVILQFCGLTAKQIPAIAEVNPDKFGCYTPGTLIPIISEADAHARHPDLLLVMPWHFKTNLVEREAGFLSRGGRMIFPLPKIEIVEGHQ